MNDKILIAVFVALIVLTKLAVNFVDRKLSASTVFALRIVISFFAAGVGAAVARLIHADISVFLCTVASAGAFVVAFWFNGPGVWTGDEA